MSAVMCFCGVSLTLLLIVARLSMSCCWLRRMWSAIVQVDSEGSSCYDQGEVAGYLYPQHSPTSRQGYQVRVTTCRDHVIYNHMIYATQGHMTFEPGEPTGGMARQAHISSQASQQERWLEELAFRARRANRCDSSKSLKHHPLYKQ